MPSLLDKYNNALSMPTSNYKTERLRRNQHLSILNRSEVERFGLENNLELMYNSLPHHPAEMTVIKDDGARYVYGIAAYNLRQEETSFNVGRRKLNSQQQVKLELDIDRESGLVKYDYNDNSMNNDRGLDNAYSNTILPPYAHSFLLTAILSTDYVDIDGVRGPSKGDIGSYTKFTYSKLSNSYKWRVPYDQFHANFNEGIKVNQDDNQANYTYGEKEQWYLSKIETKNSVAIFTTEDRKDGFDVIDKNGGMGDNTTKLLRKISLYSKQDYDLNPSNAIPIKEVHFDYSYELCPNVPNNNGITSGPDDNTAKGKLTLKRVFFTYGTSLRGKFSPYTFEYNSGDLNPAYGLKNYDRWGNYKPNNPDHYNCEFPYVEQEKTNADNYAQAWLLKSITLPSGGKITVFYESDDYAYVQDQRAMQMFRIVGLYDENVNMQDPGILQYTDNHVLIDAANTKEYLLFKLQENIPISGSDVTDQKKFREKYLGNTANLYFRINVNVRNDNNPAYEYVSGYCELEDVTNKDNAFMMSDGTVSGYYTHGYLKIKKVGVGDGSSNSVHPMSKAAWQFGRLNMANELYGKYDDNTTNVEKFIHKVSDAAFIKPLLQALIGQNGWLFLNGFGMKINIGKSFVRLDNPNGLKLGGGSRVKKITISDRWNSMIPGGTTEDEAIYGQEYAYTTIDPSTGEVISSGVASMEPGIGADESPLKQPIYFGDKEQKLLAPDDRFYLEEPVGESFFPTPSVGYSKVTVKNLQHQNVTRHATGKVVNEFYTAKDFPAIVQRTSLDAKQTSITPLLRVFKKYTRCYMTASQGFSIELNDMHGKPKAVWVYAENSSSPISGTEYRYKCQPYQKDDKSAKGFRLDNSVQVIYPDGQVKIKELGVEYDMINDFRQETTTSYSGGSELNLDNFLAGVLPISIPSLYSGVQSDRRGFRSATMTKLINRYGLVDEVIAYDLGSKVGTKNLVYDSETGDVILTQTKNEFEDDIYSFIYPAHWYYEGMGPAYKNYKVSFEDIDFSSQGVANVTNAGDWFVLGDEIISGNEKGWVTQIDANSNTITVVNEIGHPFKAGQNDQDFTIIRSGRRNILKANIGSIVSMDNPLKGLLNNSISKVVNASSQVFRDDWKTYCECFEGESSLMKISTNPYATGRKGIWRPFKSYTYLSNRSLSVYNSNTNIRHDGVLVKYVPFWQWNGSFWAINEAGWTWTSEITEYSPFGMELENKDPLNRFSAATYGYNNSLPMSVAANATYYEIGFDGFEDYEFSNCTNDHFSFKANSGNVIDTSSHTGRRSIHVTTGNEIKISKQINNCNQ